MKLKVVSTDGSEKGSIDLPAIFSESVRKDIIKRAVDAIEANNRQRYGAKPDAGMRASAKLSRRRHDYRGSYGHGISRVPRKIMSRRGTRFNWVAAVAPGTVGGRRAHPPKADKIFDKKINAKENTLAIRSALAATMDKNLVSERGHNIPEGYPFVIDNAVEKIAKTKELILILKKLGFEKELKRTEKKKIRAGKGKSRSRKYITKTGLLLITAENAPLMKSVGNVLGFEVATTEYLNAKLLAPGGVPGRMVLFSQAAIEKINNNQLFTDNRVKKEVKKKSPKIKKVKKVKPKKTIVKPKVKKPMAEKKDKLKND